jgi:hypothetical protein
MEVIMRLAFQVVKLDRKGVTDGAKILIVFSCRDDDNRIVSQTEKETDMNNKTNHRLDASAFLLDGLEERRMLSASHGHHHVAVHHATTHTVRHAVVHSATVKHAHKAARHATVTASNGTSSDETTILFSDAPAAVQTGLQALAPAGFTIPPTQSVEVHTPSTGLAIYSTEIKIPGVESHLTVDANGAPFTPTGEGDHGGQGNNENDLLFSAVPSLVQTALQSQLPAGATIAATQEVDVFTNASNVQVYVLHLDANGTETIVAADATGTVVTVPTDGGGEHSGGDHGGGEHGGHDGGGND